MFSCRTCHVAEPATSPCVFQNKLHSQVGDTAGVTQDVASDPTVGLPLCTLCGEQIICEQCEDLCRRDELPFEDEDFNTAVTEPA